MVILLRSELIDFYDYVHVRIKMDFDSEDLI